MTIEEKIKETIQAMGRAPRVFASNKESFVFQIRMMLFLLGKMNHHNDRQKLFKMAGMVYGSSFINCTDSFSDEWAKEIVDYALTLIDK